MLDFWDVLSLVSIVANVIFDFIAVEIILGVDFVKKNLVLIIPLISVLSLLILVGTAYEYNEEILNILSMVILGFYFFIYKKYYLKTSLINALIVVSNLDLAASILGDILDVMIPGKTSYYDIYTTLLSVLFLLIIVKFKAEFNNWISNQNKYLFLILNLYIYITVSFVYENILKIKSFLTVAKLSSIIFLLQLIFLIGMYIVAAKTRKNILDKAKQEQKEAELKQLKIENQKVNEEYTKLKEYAEYLDKNEDELRKFKHDYQNILNSLRVSAENHNATELVEKLDKYTKSQINDKALRKYKDVNHVKVAGLKSIAIAKLAKLYNLGIDYSFGCEQEITDLSNRVNELDITRMIGIAFDNAIEASLELREKGYQPAVDAMYVLEDGSFEFQVRNKIVDTKETKELSKKGFTTKENHLGLGLANVKEIAQKYVKDVLVDYGIVDGWFVFNLIILPPEKWLGED